MAEVKGKRVRGRVLVGVKHGVGREVFPGVVSKLVTVDEGRYGVVSVRGKQARVFRKFGTSPHYDWVLSDSL